MDDLTDLIVKGIAWLVIFVFVGTAFVRLSGG